MDEIERIVRGSGQGAPAAAGTQDGPDEIERIVRGNAALGGGSALPRGPNLGVHGLPPEVAWRPPSFDPGDAPAGPPLDPRRAQTPEAFRLKRMAGTIENQGQTTGSFLESLAWLQQLQAQDPNHPALDMLRAQVLGSSSARIPARGEPFTVPSHVFPVTRPQAAAISREQARRGVAPPEAGARETPVADLVMGRGQEQDKYDLSNRQKGIIFEQETAKLLEPVGRAWSSQYNPLKYPVEALGAALRPLDKAIPGALVGAISPKGSALTGALTAMDPLGRYSPTGARVGTFSGQPPSYTDALRMAVERWGTTMPGDEIRDAAGNVVLPARKQLLGIPDSGPTVAGLGLAADVLLSPSTWLGPARPRTLPGAMLDARAAPQRIGMQFGGPFRLLNRGQPVLIPSHAISAVARFPGSALERVPALRGKTWPGKIGPAQAVEAAPKVLARTPVPGTGTDVGDILGDLLDRYHQLRKPSPLVDDATRAALVSAAQMRESGTTAQITRNQETLTRVLGDLSLDDQRIIREAVENPDAFNWPNAGPRPRLRQVPPLALPPRGSTQVPPGGFVAPTPETALSTQRAPNWTAVDPRPAPGPDGVIDFGRARVVPPRGALPGQANVGPGPFTETPWLTLDQQERAARIENMMRDFRRAFQERGNFRGNQSVPGIVRDWADQELMDEIGRFQGRPDYFPRERTAESLAAWKRGVRTEPVGRGQGSRATTQYGFREQRVEPAKINAWIDQVNVARRANGQPLLEHVQDTTSSLNRFWRQLPPELRKELGGGLAGEAERFLDVPIEALARYQARATKAINDFDYMETLSRLRDAKGNPIVRPIVRADGSGKVYEALPMERRAGNAVAPDRLAQAGEREIYGYRYPANPSWREAFPNMAVPENLATDLERLGRPYWSRLEQLLVKPLHKIQLPWKVAATSGAGPRFALRNYYSQQMMNLQEYGFRAADPGVQKLSHVLALGDDVLESMPAGAWRALGYPRGLQTPIRVAGDTITLRELRETARQTGLWRTMPEAELWAGAPPGIAPSGAAHAAESGMGKAMRWSQTAANFVGPINPFSKSFLPTKGVKIPQQVPLVGGARVGFHPMAEYFERQGRMAALVLELRTGKPLAQAAQDAARVHVNYGSFSPAFEKYGTLWAPFAKFGVGRLPMEVSAALQRPGMSMLPSRVMEAGEATVRPQVSQKFEAEPKSELILEGGGRLTSWPGEKGLPLMEEEGAGVQGPFRLPYSSLSPFANQTLNILGAPARVAGAEARPEQLKREVFENAFPAIKAPLEIMTGENVFTGEPVSLYDAKPAPRAIQKLFESNPELASKWPLSAAYVRSPTNPDVKYLAVPGWVALVLRYYPNVQAADLAAGLAGGRKAYDNQTALALRLLGITQVLHDPMVPASQEAKRRAKVQEKRKADVESWLQLEPGEKPPGE